MHSAIIAFIYLLSTLTSSHVHAVAPPSVSAPDAIVIDGWTGSTLYAKNPDALHDPASTVKVMTALVVLQHHIPLKRVVTVNWIAAHYGGSSAGLLDGEQMTVWNLLHGMLMPSGNDAAVALAEATAGSTPHFVALMNEEAIALHLRHTHYTTANGFDTPGQVTSARDLADLARRAMMNPIFARVVRTRSWTARSVDGRLSHHWVNLNRLLWMSREVDGVKTGTTPGAGACLVSSAREGGKWVVAVNLGGSAGRRFTDGASLLNYGLQVDNAPPPAR